MTTTPWPVHALAALWPVVLVGAGLWFHQNSPERLYGKAWELMRASRQLDAASAFDAAFDARKSDAKKEEALFWSAKAYEQAGQRETALQRYRTLTANYHGYWLAESLYTQAQLEKSSGNLAPSQMAARRLLQEFPNDRWAQRLIQETKP